MGVSVRARHEQVRGGWLLTAPAPHVKGGGEEKGGPER